MLHRASVSGQQSSLQFRQMGQQLLAGKHGLEPLLGAHAGDGAAGGDKKADVVWT